jgi:SAM-dependent methyltransferase
VTADASSAYAGTADAWASGPGRLYEALARVIVAAYPAPVLDQRVLDAGAGTGAASVALREHGVRVTALDSAPDMVAHLRTSGFDAVIGDLRFLPFEDGSFDGVVAAFSISHVDPTRALAEARRVVRDGGVVVAGVFAAQPASASKEAIDAVAETFGFTRPEWYVAFKRDLEPKSNTAQLLSGCAHDAGLSEIGIEQHVVETGIATPEAIVASRVGMAHLAPFVATLTRGRRAQFIAACVTAVARDPQPLRPTILVLSSRARA